MKNLLFILFLFFAGCSVNNSEFVNISNTNKTAVIQLIKNAHLKPNSVVIVTTIANINDLENSSQLGRTLSEQIINTFVNNGIKVKELKFSNNVFVKKRTGEFILSRNIKKLAHDINVEYVVVGTYSKMKDSTYVNLKIINPSNDIIIASTDYTINN